MSPGRGACDPCPLLILIVLLIHCVPLVHCRNLSWNTTDESLRNVSLILVYSPHCYSTTESMSSWKKKKSFWFWICFNFLCYSGIRSIWRCYGCARFPWKMFIVFWLPCLMHNFFHLRISAIALQILCCKMIHFIQIRVNFATCIWLWHVAMFHVTLCIDLPYFRRSWWKTAKPADHVDSAS